MSVVSSTYLCTKQSGLRSLISTKNERGPNQEPRLLMFMFNKNLERQEAQLMLTTGSTRLAVNQGQQT